MNEDLSELLALLNSHQVRFLVIGAHALAFHGKPRFTEDIDLWVDRTEDNAARLGAALEEFGAAIGGEGVSRFASPDKQIVRLGAAPNMVDILNFAGDDSFADVWSRGIHGMINGTEVVFPSREDLARMKRAAGRPQDIADIEKLS